MAKVKFEIEIPENDSLMMKVNNTIHEYSGWLEEDGEIPSHEIAEDEYFSNIVYSIDLTKTDIIRSEAAKTMNDAFGKISEFIIEEIPNMKTSKNTAIIAFEIIVPDNAGNDSQNFCEVARETIHEHFKGSQDYIDSHVVVWDNKDDEGTIIETGVTIGLGDAVDKLGSFEKFTDAYFDVVGLPEYYGVIFKHTSYKAAIMDKLEDVKTKIIETDLTMDDLTVIMIKVDQLQDAIDMRIINPEPDDGQTDMNGSSTTDILASVTNDLCGLRTRIKGCMSQYESGGVAFLNLVDVCDNLKRTINIISSICTNNTDSTASSDNSEA